VLTLGSKIIRATGYHLLDLVIGSEGTLGVVTQVTVRLLALPAHRAALLVPFETLAGAAGAVAEIIRRRLLPAALEFMDAGSIDASRRFLGAEMPFPEAGAHLIVEVDGHSEESVRAEYEAIGELCLARGTSACWSPKHARPGRCGSAPGDREAVKSPRWRVASRTSSSADGDPRLVARLGKSARGQRSRDLLRHASDERAREHLHRAGRRGLGAREGESS
jgi:FAD/FMN-containing dehydrogenase